jgi:membrane-associated phospholipid phosphatase
MDKYSVHAVKGMLGLRTVLSGLLLVGLCWAAAWWPRFPGDLAMSQFLQSLFPGEREWAQAITATGKNPYRWGLLLLGMGATWKLCGTRWLILPVLCFLVMLGLDQVLKPLIGRPRPSPELVEVTGSSAGYSCPSTFGLIQAGTVGWMILLSWYFLSGTPRWWAMGLGILWLLLGAAARMVLGGHWASDLFVAYALGGWVGWCLIQCAVQLKLPVAKLHGP